MTLLAFWQRLTGTEARALRRQRDAYAEQAGVERQRADAAERRLAGVPARVRRTHVAMNARAEFVALYQQACCDRDKATALLRSLMRGEPGAAARAANYVAGCRVADIGPETWMPGEQKPDE